jgi:nucleoside-diphosphate-sugar epimerase
MLADVLPQSARLIVTRSSIIPARPGRALRATGLRAQIARIERGEQLPRLSLGNLSAQRDFLDVEDVVDAYLRLIDARACRSAQLSTSPPGTRDAISDVLDRLRALALTKFEINVDPNRVRASEVAALSATHRSCARRPAGLRPAQSTTCCRACSSIGASVSPPPTRADERQRKPPAPLRIARAHSFARGASRIATA